MRINFSVQYLVWSLIGVALIAPIAVQAQPISPLNRNKPWASACETALTNRIKRDHPHAGRVQTLADDEYEYPASNAETSVYGYGQYEGSDTAWHLFTFSCIYNIRQGKVSEITYDVYDVSR